MHRYKRKFAPINLLGREQIEMLHRGTMQILENTGVVFQDRQALEVFQKSGCRVNHDNGVVQFPSDLIEDCLGNCPDTFDIKARDPQNDLVFDNEVLYFYNSMGNKTVALDTWEMRTPTLTEQHEAVRVLDALDNLHIVGCYTPYMEIAGVAPIMMLPVTFASRLRNSSKVVQTGYSGDSEIFAIQMAQALGIEASGWVMAGPPLTFYEDACKAAFRFAAAGFPVFIVSGVGYGGTGPATIAGSSVTNNAELIAGAVLVQLIHPGTRIVAADFTFPVDMKTGGPCLGNVASALHAAVFCQAWRNYGIPTCVSSSGYSNSKKCDHQIGSEKTGSALIAALAGANVVSLHGGIYAEMSYHPVQSIMDDDIAGMIGRFIESVEVSEETMALDLIQAVGAAPGHYLDTRHTFDWWRRERYMPSVADDLNYDRWMKSGKKDSFTYSREKMEQILAAHEPMPLTEDQHAEIDRILDDALKYYRGENNPTT